MSNSLKNNFNGVKIKEIELKLRVVADKQFEMMINDNSVGVCNSALSGLTNTGAQLIKTFLRQLNGEIEDLSKKDGASFRISFSCV